MTKIGEILQGIMQFIQEGKETSQFRNNQSSLDRDNYKFRKHGRLEAI